MQSWLRLMQRTMRRLDTHVEVMMVIIILIPMALFLFLASRALAWEMKDSGTWEFWVDLIFFLLADWNKEILSRSKNTITLPYSIQLFWDRLSEKKHQSARDKTERWHGYSLEFCILAKFVFLHVENLFFLSGANIFSFTFTVACLWVKKILLNFRGAKRTLFLHVWKERRPEIRAYFVVISH